VRQLAHSYLVVATDSGSANPLRQLCQLLDLADGTSSNGFWFRQSIATALTVPPLYCPSASRVGDTVLRCLRRHDTTAETTAVDTVADKLTIADAAKHFGLTRDGVRKRLLRGKLTGVMLDGVQYVLVDKSASPSSNGDAVHDVSATLVAQLQSENAWLRGELESRRREVSELHVLLAQRPALPAPREADSFTESVNESRPWWARWAWWRR
jgi:hypothetical protein